VLAEPIEVALELAAVLDRLKIDDLVGGSFASSIHGIPRATQDIDFLAFLAENCVNPLVASIQAAFYTYRLAVFPRRYAG